MNKKKIKIKEEPVESIPIEDDPLRIDENDLVPEPIQICVMKKGTLGNVPPKTISKCKICSSMFVNLEAYENHYKTVHRKDKKILKCEECSEIFDSLDFYTIHFNTFHRIFCGVCNASFKNLSDVFEHQEYLHTVDVLPVLFNCDVCFMGFNTFVQHMTHMQTHVLIKEQTASQKSSPKAHISHVFGCNICSNVFNSKYGLKKHLLEHNSIRNCCEYCGKSFRTQKYLDNHILITHKVLAAFLQCPLCRHKFKTQQRLDRHVKLHLAEKEIECEFCPLKFKKKSVSIN